MHDSSQMIHFIDQKRYRSKRHCEISCSLHLDHCPDAAGTFHLSHYRPHLLLNIDRTLLCFPKDASHLALAPNALFPKLQHLSVHIAKSSSTLVSLIVSHPRQLLHHLLIFYFV